MVFIDIPHDNMKRTFTKVKATYRQEKPQSALSPFPYWVGEDLTDGSVLNYVQDGQGHMSGSLVDLTNHNVLQFHNKNGQYMVTITALSDFDPELHPTNDNRRKLAIKSGASSKNGLIASLLCFTYFIQCRVLIK